MKYVKVLGIGCTNCKNTVQLIRQVVDELGVSIQLEKIESLPEIMKYKVMSTPAVVIDDRVVHAGGIPAREAVQSWF
ncbi:thioredoxin family protein [Aeromonas hydrophila]|uniref:thioredoxin family protein n=1 Tax=Aeromonas TaxID=642 RepID=UPI0004931533|nr:thioredoxin family protein [Aeromonas hydrophila]HAT1543776.1 thioredoxin family protein [Aeromonas hydrophila]HAT1554244.1 thioredoxin family protein [Aeromonas hydrophila]